MTTMAGEQHLRRRDARLLLIDGGHWLLVLVLMGAIIGGIGDVTRIIEENDDMRTRIIPVMLVATVAAFAMVGALATRTAAQHPMGRRRRRMRRRRSIRNERR